MKNATIYDVARESGLSIKTVSRVMNRDPGVKPHNRERILQVAEDLSYKPSLSARSLAGARSFVIAAFLDAELTLDHWRSGRATDYVTRLQLGAITECRAAGYHFTFELIDHDPTRLRREAREFIQALKPDGIILTPPSCDDPEMIELLDAARVRYARLGSDSAIPGGMQLHLGDRSGAFAVTKHLIDLGHRKIALITGPFQRSTSSERLGGFREAMQSAGLEVDEHWICGGDFTFQSGIDATRALMAMSRRPTAIFACSDEMALGALTTLATIGLECPGDVSIAGFDDSVGARFSHPQLTTLRQPVAEMAAEAAKRLISPDAYKVGFLGEEHCGLLIPGNSTAPPRS